MTTAFPANLHRVLLLGSFLLFGVSASSEIYQGIGPLDTLKDLKQKFPTAEFERLSPAWAQDADVLYRITGKGVPGRIVVTFYDNRPEWREQLKKESDPGLRKILEEGVSLDDDSIQVEWVRWIPDEPLPLQRLVAKYGPPSEKGFGEDDFRPYRAWSDRGILANLTDDEKHVDMMEFSFTRADLRRAWLEKHGRVPSYLQENAPAKPKQPKK
jgi:hypothetical protein